MIKIAKSFYRAGISPAGKEAAMKPMAALCLCSLFFLPLWGCTAPQNNGNPPLSAETAAPSSQLSLSADGPVTIQSQCQKQEVRDAEGALLATISHSRPVLLGSTKGIASLNQLFEKDEEEYLSSATQNWQQQAEEDKLLLGKNFQPYAIESSYEITYNNAGLLSVLRTEYQNTGGPYPALRRLSGTYLTSSGQSLSLEQILAGDQQTVSQQVINCFTQLIQSDPRQFYPNAQDTLPDLINKVGFYLSGNQICLYLPQETIAARAYGFPEVSLPYDQQDLFATPIPTVNMDAQHLKAAMRLLYEKVVPGLPQDQRTGVRMVSEGEGEASGEPIYIIRLYLPPEETVGRYGVGQQTGSIYKQEKTGTYTFLSR